ncbi:hypothetical protein AA21291_1740 [Swaminathania salitolerans LMG 21291]|uniref:Uncharacterized protein n=1 Tax=Swaminathania salitolerans TaxID=182838 RepID=A0A511BS40_9PROT|nr:hypothetical protein AA21291_1740 [Swaminathania salitolerans LMG 21291]GEL02932.1 hypothetical protein SSA02_20950 [Swaminathania salitolerans]
MAFRREYAINRRDCAIVPDTGLGFAAWQQRLRLLVGLHTCDRHTTEPFRQGNPAVRTADDREAARCCRFRGRYRDSYRLDRRGNSESGQFGKATSGTGFGMFGFSFHTHQNDLFCFNYAP